MATASKPEHYASARLGLVAFQFFGSQTATGSGTGNPAQLAHGISIALYNTAFGLLVAIPSLIFWRYFRGRVDAYLLTLELSAATLAHHIAVLRK